MNLDHILHYEKLTQCQQRCRCKQTKTQNKTKTPTVYNSPREKTDNLCLWVRVKIS